MKTLITILSLMFVNFVFTQNSVLNINYQSDIPSICSEMTVTMQHDILDRHFLYVANKEAGLKIYDISNNLNPQLSATVSTDQFLNMEVINLTQQGNYLFLATGNIWNTDSSGIVIIDIQNPLNPIVTDFYFLQSSTHGAGIVQVEGNYAYLGAMQDGLIMLDISDKNNIQFISQFIPDVNFPINNPTNPDIYNLRGMEVRNDTIYACYDAGGIRIIDVTNKNNPNEIGHYCNPVMYTPWDHPKAYNNLTLDGNLAYVAVDYCGMEILDISDPGNIELIGWWNPYGCPDNNWFTSPVHANEIRLNKACKQVFISTGKSDLFVLDVTDPSSPDSLDYYGGVNNSIGTWGVNIYANEIYLSYICVPWPYIPFQSDWTGVKILQYENCSNKLKEITTDYLSIYPNPVKDVMHIQTTKGSIEHYKIINQTGQLIQQGRPDSSDFTIQTEDIKPGIYYLQIIDNSEVTFISFYKPQFD